MSSDKSQTQVSGTVAAIGQGTSEGPLSASAERMAFNEASVAVRAMADKGEARDKARTDSVYSALTETEMKALDGSLLVEMMGTNPEAVKHSGKDWARTAAQKAGRERELDIMVVGFREVEERALKKSVTNLLASVKDLNNMPPILVKSLQQSLQRLGMYHGEIDGDASNPGLGGALEEFADSHPVAKKLLDEGRISITSNRQSSLNRAFETNAKAVSVVTNTGEKAIMDMFREPRRVAAPALAL